MPKTKKKKTKKANKEMMHEMPNGMMMSDKEMEKYHKTRGMSKMGKATGGRMR